MKKSLKVLLSLAGVSYLASSEVRVQNLQRVTLFALDAETCGRVGIEREKVRECLKSRGYSVETRSPDTDMVAPERILESLHLRVYYAVVSYGPGGRVVSTEINTHIGAL